jgi:hypothetical protein
MRQQLFGSPAAPCFTASDDAKTAYFFIYAKRTAKSDLMLIKVSINVIKTFFY